MTRFDDEQIAFFKENLLNDLLALLGWIPSSPPGCIVSGQINITVYSLG